jgi:hypothetical protein
MSMEHARTMQMAVMAVCSLVDYFISSPSLVFEPSGQPKLGAYLNLLDRDSCPLRAGGDGKFDHMPVTLTIDIGILRMHGNGLRVGPARGRRQSM